MMQVSKEIFFEYVVRQGLKQIDQIWSNSTSTMVLAYVKRGKERARLEYGPTQDKYFVAVK